jgi:hypothetical protein
MSDDKMKDNVTTAKQDQNNFVLSRIGEIKN